MNYLLAARHLTDEDLSASTDYQESKWTLWDGHPLTANGGEEE